MVPLVPDEVQPDYSPEQVTRVLGAIPTTLLLDLRDRAIVALLYDRGVRCAELCSIRVCDVDHEARRIHIRHGKGARAVSSRVPMRLRRC
jgi:site-specific recombinase XerD